MGYTGILLKISTKSTEGGLYTHSKPSNGHALGQRFFLEWHGSQGYHLYLLKPNAVALRYLLWVYELIFETLMLGAGKKIRAGPRGKAPEGKGTTRGSV